MSMQSYNDTTSRNEFYNTSTWRHIRDQVLKRDNHECTWCKRAGKVTLKGDSILEVDHIKELKDHPELALEMDNLRTLCRQHHNIRHNRFKKKYNKWEDDERWD